MDQQNAKKPHNFMESAAMKKMLNIAGKLYSDSPQLYEKNKDMSYLLKVSLKQETGVHLPPINGHDQEAKGGKTQNTIKTPFFIANEYEQLYKEYELEQKRRNDLISEKQTKLKKYIVKEQEYRERIEEYTKKIR